MAEIKVNEVYTREEAEDLLKISQATMMRLIKKGIIRAAKIGGQYRILGAELLRQLLAQDDYETVRAFYRSAREKIQALEAELEKDEFQKTAVSPVRAEVSDER